MPLLDGNSVLRKMEKPPWFLPCARRGTAAADERKPSWRSDNIIAPTVNAFDKNKDYTETPLGSFAERQVPIQSRLAFRKVRYFGGARDFR